ncbi:Chemotaxis response regulator protein-glutamate methylesterase [compost metagenome]
MSTILIADRLPVIRAALRSMLERAGHEVIGEADNGPDALSQCRQLKPDLLITELGIPRLGGLDLVRRLKSGGNGTRVVIYSSQESDLYASRSMQAGADAYVSKIEALDDLEIAVSSVLHGRCYFPSVVAQSKDFDTSAAQRRNEIGQLSARELTVLQLLAKGLSNQQIADQLALSYKTVSTYKVRLQQKLHVSSTFQLLEVARTTGLVKTVADVSAPPAELPQAAELEKEHTMLRALVDAVPAPMMVRDREGRLLMCNSHFLERVGVRSFEEICGLRLEDSPWYSPELRERIARRYREAVENEESLALESVIEEHGQAQPTYVWCTPYRDSQGRVIGMVGGTRNLSRRDSVLIELRHEKALVESMSRMKSEALSAVALELYPLLKVMDSLMAAANRLDDIEQIRQALGNGAHVLSDMQKVLDKVELLIDLDLLQTAPGTEAHHLGELTGEILEALRGQLLEGGGELVIDSHDLALTVAWIDVAHYSQLLDSLLRLLVRGEARPRIRLTLHSSVIPGGFMKFLLEIHSTGEHAAEALDGQGSDRLTLVHLRSLLDVLGAQIRRQDPAGGADGEVWLLEFKLPLARSAPGLA